MKKIYLKPIVEKIAIGNECNFMNASFNTGGEKQGTDDKDYGDGQKGDIEVGTKGTNWNGWDD